MARFSDRSPFLRIGALLAATTSAALIGSSSAAAAAGGNALPVGDNGATTFGTTPSGLTVKSVRASGDDGNGPANTLDGNPSTRWSATGDGAWISYDLGTDTTVGSVDIAWYMGSTRVTTFDIQTAPAATPTAWTTLAAWKSGGTTDGFERYDLKDTRSRYVRIVGHGNSKNAWTSIAEVALSGAADDNSDDSDSDTSTCKNPGQALDLTNWKVTLPTGAAEQPTEIKQPELATHPVAPWFLPTAGCTGLTFRAPVNGVTTSGSGNPRSELREMTKNGSTNASWSSKSGTHTMIVTQAVTALPAVKPHVVAGQIHDAKRDISVFRVEGNKVYVTKANDSHYALAADNYVLGTKFEAKFVVTGNTVKAYYNGKLVTTISTSFTGAYFKAGTYTQANCTNSAPCASSNFGEVVVYGLTVQHS